MSVGKPVKTFCPEGWRSCPVLTPVKTLCPPDKIASNCYWRRVKRASPAGKTFVCPEGKVCPGLSRNSTQFCQERTFFVRSGHFLTGPVICLRHVGVLCAALHKVQHLHTHQASLQLKTASRFLPRWQVWTAFQQNFHDGKFGQVFRRTWFGGFDSKGGNKLSISCFHTKLEIHSFSQVSFHQFRNHGFQWI